MMRSGIATDRRRTRAMLCVILYCASASSPAMAQPAPLITHPDLVLFAGATLGTAALSKLDVRLAHAFYDSAFQVNHPGITSAANRASLATETVFMITGATVWGVARLRHSDGTADVALHTTEGLAATAMFIQVIRGVLGRTRPYVVDAVGEKRNGQPYDFQLLAGFRSFNYRSFPSMHAMASFAVASGLATEMKRRDTNHRGLITPLLYAGATLPSLSRMYLDEHWASDIALGVFLGVFAGQKAVNYSHDHPGNYFDRKLLAPKISATFTRSAAGLSFTLLPF
jgi:membrane-associated phospholipid phosphatase